MITPDEIRRKALKIWEGQAFLRAQLTGSAMFPLSIPFGKMKSGEMLRNFEKLRAWVEDLRSGSELHTGMYVNTWNQSSLPKGVRQSLFESRIPRGKKYPMTL
jgi:hypothetical protein